MFECLREVGPLGGLVVEQATTRAAADLAAAGPEERDCMGRRRKYNPKKECR